MEEQHHPELVGKPFAVGGRPEQRGVVSSCSYAARQQGVHSAMPTAQAVRICPGLILIPGNHSAYRAASDKVMQILRDVTPLVEQISIDEAFLDVSDLPDDLEFFARSLQQRIKENTDLPCSIGGAANKLVAKMATDYGKASHKSGGYPNAITIIPPGKERTFLAQLPVKNLWGVGPKTTERLRRLGILTIGDLAAKPLEFLIKNFGKWGYDLSAHARGEDDQPVTIEHAVKSISQEVTYDRDVSDRTILIRTLQEQADQVGYRLRQESLCGNVVRIKLRWPDFTTLTRQTTLDLATDADGVIAAEAINLFERVWEPGRAVRLLGVGVSGLSASAHQLNLFDDTPEKERKLLSAVDLLRQKYGKNIVRRGSSINKRKNS